MILGLWESAYAKMLAMRVERPEFESQNPGQKFPKECDGLSL